MAYECSRPETEEVNPLVVAQHVRNELHFVQDAVADADIAAGHVHESPRRQAPEDRLIKLNALLVGEDETGNNDHDTGVKNEFVIGALPRDRGEDRDVDDVDDKDRAILLADTGQGKAP